MKNISYITIAIGASLLVLLICSTTTQPVAGQEPDESVFPKGKAELGRLVFLVKQCHKCHTIPGETFPEIDLPFAADISLGGENNRGWGRDDYAHHIMDPGHLISPDHQKAMITIGDKLGAEVSPMPDFSDILTVKDLIHLATYLAEID